MRLPLEQGLGAGSKPVCHQVWKRTSSVLMLNFIYTENLIGSRGFKKSDSLNELDYYTMLTVLYLSYTTYTIFFFKVFILDILATLSNNNLAKSTI